MERTALSLLKAAALRQGAAFSTRPHLVDRLRILGGSARELYYDGPYHRYRPGTSCDLWQENYRPHAVGACSILAALLHIGVAQTHRTLRNILDWTE